MDIFNSLLYFLFTFTLARALLLLARGSKTKGRKLPPGPVPLPVIGNLLKLGEQPHKSLAELAKVHGPIMTLKLGQITTVVFSSSAMAKEVLQKQDLAFSSRSVPNAIRAYNHCQYSVVWLPVASQWRSLRKILNSNIFSGNRLDANQHLRRRKVKELITYLGNSCQTGASVDIGHAAFRTSLNLLSNTIFSVDLADPYSDTAKEFRDLAWNVMVEAGKPNLVDYFPALERVDPQGIRRRMTVHCEKLLDMFGRLINERLELRRLRKAIVSSDALDVLLNIEDSGDEIDLNHIEHMCLDLFTAGIDTTASTLEWAMAELLRNPETLVQAKAELDQVIGKGKEIEESDIAQLPYLRAIVKETLRMHPPAPLLIPRKVGKDCEVGGFTVPKGSQVLVNVWAIGRDPTTWDQPTSFIPDRFLDTELDVRGRDFELIPFGAGRRICPGLPLAMRMVTVMLGSLLNSFDWKLDEGIEAKDLDMEEKFGITLQKALPLRAIPIRI